MGQFTKYDEDIASKMCIYFRTLTQKGKRHYASIEAEKLGWGGKTYISNLLGISHKTIRGGDKELSSEQFLAQIPVGKERRPGGGRKKKEVSNPKLVKCVLSFIEEHKAGSPTDSSIYWIHLKPKEIAAHILERYGYKISHGFVKRILKDAGFKYRKLSKNLATGEYGQRNQQFKIIFDLILIVGLNVPIISMDGKKKERLGNLYRAGKLYTTGGVKVYDHDYAHLATGKVIPFGIYDLQRNEGYISIGSSHETADFIADNLLWWWDEFGIHQYPDAKDILILCDAGGANSYRHHAFKKQMLLLAAKIGVNFIICHYPPYASKWNPIEHRLFCHVHQAIQGVVFTDYQIVKEVFSKTKTDTGLKVKVRLNLKKYQKGIKTKKEEVDFDRIQFNQIIPKLSYRIAC